MTSHITCEILDRKVKNETYELIRQCSLDLCIHIFVVKLEMDVYSIDSCWTELIACFGATTFDASAACSYFSFPPKTNVILV